MILQQLGGANAIAFYASSIFSEAGKFNGFKNCFMSLLKNEEMIITSSGLC
jgi:hypothetical protein